MRIPSILFCFWVTLLLCSQVKSEASDESPNQNVEALAALVDQYDNNKPERAIEYAEQAFILLKAAPNEVIETNIYNHLSWAQIRIGDFDSAIISQHRAMELAIKNNLGDEIAYAHNVAGVIKRQQGYFGEAIEEYTKALQLREQLGDIKGIANSLNNLGVVHNLVGKYYQAIDFFNQSIFYKSQLNDHIGIANTLNNIANIYLEAGDLEKSKELHFKSLEARKALDVKPAMAESYNSIGNLYLLKSEYDEAREYFNKALSLNQQLGIKRSEAESLQYLGDLSTRLNEFSTAIQHYQQALVLTSEMTDDDRSVGLLVKLAKIASEQKNFSLASTYLERAQRLAERLRNYDLLEEVLSELAQISINQKHYEEAYQFAVRALALADDLDNNIKRQSAYFTLSKIFEERGGKEKALEYFTEYKRVSEELLKQQTQQQINVAQSRYDFERKQIENERLRHENQLREEHIARIAAEKQAEASDKKFERWSWAVMILSFSLVIIFLIYRHLQRKQLESERQVQAKMQHLQELKNEFLRMVSHELNTPVSGLVGGIELMKQEKANQELVHIVQSSTHRIRSLVEDIVDYTKFKLKGGEVELESVDLVDNFEELLTRFRCMASDKGLEFEWNINKNVPNACQYAAEIVTIVCSKLLDNAIKFTQKGSVVVDIDFDTTNEYEQIIVKIADTGIGMDSESTQRIFNLFHQENTGLSRAYDGMGLGLALCDYLITVIGAQITVESSLGKGSQFTFTFPVKVLSN